MSRRRSGIVALDVALDVLCDRGHRVGVVVRFGAHAGAQAGQYGLGGGVRFEHGVAGSTGRLRARCSVCSADVQLRWDRIRTALEDRARSGQATGEMAPATNGQVVP